jgi:hypothetical protein
MVICAMLFVWLGSLTLVVPAVADTGGYPYTSAVDCSAEFGIYSWCIDGDWLSPLGYAYRNCTDFAAWWLEANGAPDSEVRGLGNAYQWSTNAPSHGDTVNSTPSVGSVAQWGTEVGDGLGHVAIVTAVHADGSVDIAEYNEAGTGVYSTQASVRADSYIHFPGVSVQSGGSPPPPPAKHVLFDANGDGTSDVFFLSGLDGGTTGSGDLEAHGAYGSSFNTRGDFATPFAYLNTSQELPFFADVNGDGSADVCFLAGLNGGTTGSGDLDVHCAYGPSFNTRGDFATPFAYLNTSEELPFFADVNGDGSADMCFLAGLNGGTTGSGNLEIHCAYGPSFNTRGDFVTPFAYLNTSQELPFFADVNGDGSADMCFLAGLNGGTTGSGDLDVHCAYGPSFNTRGDFATPFAYLDTQTSWILDTGPGVPLAPSNATAVAGDQAATVSFATPLSDGGNPITGYTVTASPGGMTAAGSSSPITMPGLTNGKTYTFTVTASNAFGPGLASGSSTGVTPAPVPSLTSGPSPIVTPASPSTTADTAPAPGGRSTAPGPQADCVVPRLHHMTLAQARRALQHAHCQLGHVELPRHPRAHYIARVSRQSAQPGLRRHAGFPVAIILR